MSSVVEVSTIQTYSIIWLHIKTNQRRFVFFFVGMMVYTWGYFVPFAHLAEYAQVQGTKCKRWKVEGGR